MKLPSRSFFVFWYNDGMTIQGLSQETYARAKLANMKARKAKRQQKEFDDPVAWIQKYFHIPELNGPMQLQPYQTAVLRESQRKDENGHFIYSIVVWSDIKKSAKSSIAAAMALYVARKNQWGSVKIVANDLKQADSRVAMFFRRAMELNPVFVAGKTYKQRGYTTDFLDNNSVVEAIPIDPGGEAGGNDDLIIFSELWAAKHKAIKAMWSELTLSPLKFGKSQRWVETYAGNTGEAPILEQLYHRGVKEGERLDLSFDGYDLSDLEVYANGSLLCLWNDRPRCPWQTDAYYRSEASVLLDGEFRRIHRNEWTSGIDTFVPPEWWDACQDNDIPQMSKDEPLAVAMDAGVSSDNFGLVAVSKHPTIENHVVVRYARRWIPPKGGTITFSNPDDKNDRDTPEGELRWLCGKYNVVIVPYDKYQLHDMATRLSKEGVAWIFDFSQGMMREVADSDLRTLIKERRLHHNGNPMLTEHVMNAAAKKGTEERKIRIVKKAAHLKCDLVVALSMASNRILYLNL